MASSSGFTTGGPPVGSVPVPAGFQSAGSLARTELAGGGGPASTAGGGTKVQPGSAGPADMSSWGGGYGAGDYGMINPYAGSSTAGLAAALMADNPTADQGQQAQAAQSPAVARMSTAPQGSGWSGPDQTMPGDVWVTVPVDKVEVVGGKGTLTPTYATQEGYRSPQQGNTIPPVPAAGKVSR